MRAHAIKMNGPEDNPGSTRIVKIDPKRQLVFGWASVSVRKTGEQVVDAHKDLIDPEELEDAAYAFNLEFRGAGEMHQGLVKGELVESFVVTHEKLAAMGLQKNDLPLGWWVGFLIRDLDVFEKVVSGKYVGFSIQGEAAREAA